MILTKKDKELLVNRINEIETRFKTHIVRISKVMPQHFEYGFIELEDDKQNVYRLLSFKKTAHFLYMNELYKYSREDLGI